MMGQTKEVHSLIKAGANLSSTSECNTALFDAIEANHVKIVELLLQSGADPDQPHPITQEIPLSAAIEVRDETIARILINKGATIDSLSIVDLAKQNDDPSRIELALSLGADVNQIDKKTGRTALHEASTYAYGLITHCLIKNDAGKEIRDEWGNTALDLARVNSHFEIQNMLLD